MKSKLVEDDTLKGYLMSEIQLVGLPTDFTLELRGYSKSYYGRYYIKEKKVVVYCLDENDVLYDYSHILGTVLHEAVHHYQHHYEEGFVRMRGVMHNPKFYEIYEKAKRKLIDMGVMDCA